VIYCYGRRLLHSLTPSREIVEGKGKNGGIVEGDCRVSGGSL